MTLFQLFKRYLALIILAVLLVGGIAHFFVFRFFIHRSTDGILYEYKQYIENYVKLNDTLVASSLSVLQPPRVEERLIDDPQNYRTIFKDTLLYSESTGEFLPYRQLYFTVSYKNKSHLVNVNQPTVESDDLFYAVCASLILFVILFVISSYLLGNYVQHKLWSPFYKLLNTVQLYDLQKTEKIQLEDTGIMEFDELSHVINRMMDKIYADYVNLKTFTEDASHEMQTPLSVIKSKLDLLIQSGNTSDENARAIQAMTNAVTRLSKLNRSLLLLAKINNNQYQDKEVVNLTSIIKDYLTDLSELIELKSIQVHFAVSDLSVEMNGALAEIIISNLLSNAIRYNVENGVIDIIVNKNELRIANTSKIIDTSVDLFSRFGKHKGASDSTGMGLNIVKSICDTNGFAVTYWYNEGMFNIRIAFL